mgnify:CR=1 FL=1
MKDSTSSEDTESINRTVSPGDGKKLKESSQYKYKRLYELVHSKNGYTRYRNEDFFLIILAYKFTRNETILSKHFPLLFADGGRKRDFIRLMEIMPDEKNLIQKYVIDSFSDKRNNKRLLNYYRHEQLARRSANGNWRTLYAVIKAKDQPFANEVAILRLAKSLFKLVDDNFDSLIKNNQSLSPSNIQVKCSNYSSLENPTKRVSLKLRISPRSNVIVDRRFQPEPWGKDKYISFVAQIGRILRSAMVGRMEYSIMFNHVHKASYDNTGPARYCVIRSSWITRKYGIYLDRSATGGIHVPYTPWLDNVLSAMLAWPGSWVANDFIDSEYGNFKNHFLERLATHKMFYGTTSNTSIYPVQIDLNKFSEDESFSDFDLLNIATVQTAFPQLSLFKSDLKMDDSDNRRKQRLHLADMLQMLSKTFKTHKVLDSNLSCLNLIIFPELSVHIDDCYKLEQFAGETNCMIFCGQVYHDHPEEKNKIVNTGLWLIPQYRDTDSGQSFIRLEQGKYHMTEKEKDFGITSYRPVQWLIQGYTENEEQEKEFHWALSASICYDATDIKLAADLRDYVDCYIVSAANQDIPTFDNMVQALRYHMYNHTVIVNSGEFGGSAVQAPYKDSWERVLLHNHGKCQASVTIRTLELDHFKNNSSNKTKTAPAGYTERKY